LQTNKDPELVEGDAESRKILCAERIREADERSTAQSRMLWMKKQRYFVPRSPGY